VRSTAAAGPSSFSAYIPPWMSSRAALNFSAQKKLDESVLASDSNTTLAETGGGGGGGARGVSLAAKRDDDLETHHDGRAEGG